MKKSNALTQVPEAKPGADSVSPFSKKSNQAKANSTGFKASPCGLQDITKVITSIFHCPEHEQRALFYELTKASVLSSPREVVKTLISLVPRFNRETKESIIPWAEKLLQRLKE